MNPAHVFIASISLLAVWWLGYWTGIDNRGDVWPNAPSLAFNLVAGFAAVFSLIGLIRMAL